MDGIILGDRYELLEKVGEGGMSEVYKAKCNKLNRFVAVKILKRQFANNEEISRKFKREATSIANLSDNNIVNVLDVGTQDDIDYIVMEYISGKTLKELINYNGKLSYNTTIKIALQIAGALDCAHKNNVIHRDIKPQNILVTESGEIKVTDFGIAKSIDSQTITNTTSVIGSAHYLSPEQAKGNYIDFRTDIYSFGIVLYEMVTGRLPFEGESPVTVALKHLQEQAIAPKDINSAIPDSLNKLILKAIEKDPVNRYQSAKDIIQDLQKIQENPDVTIGSPIVDESDHTIVMAPITNYYKKEDTKYEEKDDDDYDDEEFDDEEFSNEKPSMTKKKGKNVAKRILIGSSILIIIAILGTIGFFLINRSGNNEVEVPNIVGKSVDDAKLELSKIGLKLEVVSTEKSDKPEKTILSVEPKEGTKLKKDSSVKVNISSGEEKILMPDFRYYEINNIKQILDSEGLENYVIREEFSDSVGVGYLISQSPAAKTEMKKDDKIEIVISKGQEVKLVYVSDVIGKSKEEAEKYLVGLNVEINEKQTTEKSKDGIVLEQSITPDTMVEEGKLIKLTIGKYKEEKPSEPEKPTDEDNVAINIASFGIKEGMDIKEAIKILESDQIKYVLESNQIKYVIEGNGDIVESFTPEVKKGGTVTVKTKSNDKPAINENNTGNIN